MAKMSCKGLDEFASKISSMTERSEGVFKRGVYQGMSVIVKAVAAEIDKLPVAEEHGTPEKKIRTINAKQKKGLKEGLGIAKIRNDGGVVNTRTGFEGYNGIRTEKYPNGQPNAMIARSVVSGTSFRSKNDFIRRAMSASKAEAIRAAGEEMEKAIKEKMEG